jgi:hypothetical protein
MLSLFPQILFLAPYAATFLRIAIAIMLALAAWKHVTPRNLSTRLLSAIEIIIAAMLILGALTQGAVIVAGAIFILHIASARHAIFSRSTLILALLICLSLLVTGPGALAVDLPL